VKSEKTQETGQGNDFNGIFFQFFIGNGKHDNGGTGLGFPVGFHGGKLCRLGFGHIHTVEITYQGHKNGAYHGNRQSDFKGSHKNIHMLFFQKMIGRDAHDEKGGQDKGRRKNMEDLKDAVIIEENGKKIGQFRPAVAQGISHGILHKPVGGQNPDAGDITRCGHHPHDGGVCLCRHFLPSENPDADEGGFEKKGHGSFNGQQGPEYIPHILGIPGPVGAELEFKGDARDNPQGKINEKKFAPEFGHSQIYRIPCSCIFCFHIGDNNGNPKGQRYKKKMEHGGCGKLQS